MEKLEYFGSTCFFYRLRPGVVVKKPMTGWKDARGLNRCTQAISLEQKLFDHLGCHEHIVPYLGVHEESGSVLAEASYGSLQAFIDTYSYKMDIRMRWKLVLQASKSIAFIHQKGVIHSDLRPSNMLIHSEKQLAPSEHSKLPEVTLWLCDFGGSTCKELGLDGGHLPDDPFFDPRQPWKSRPTTDIFSLGSIFYNIMTGHWPHWQGPAPQGEERLAYQAKVCELFKQGLFPDITNVIGGNIIMGCWEYQYKTAQEVVDAVEAEMALLDS